MSSNRLEAFSDAVIAIVITLMVLDIPLPKEFDIGAIVELLRAIIVLFVTFIVIGAQWVRHHNLFSICNEVSAKVLWRNIIYLFFITLFPVFTKWVIENPNQVVPALGYDIIFFLIFMSFHSMQRVIFEGIEKGKIEEIKKLRQARSNKFTRMFVALIFLSIIAILGFSFIYPAISIVFFIVLPVVSSLINLWNDKHEGNLR